MVSCFLNRRFFLLFCFSSRCCIVCSQIYSFWLPRWYLQILWWFFNSVHMPISKKSQKTKSSSSYCLYVYIWIRKRIAIKLRKLQILRKDCSYIFYMLIFFLTNGAYDATYKNIIVHGNYFIICAIKIHVSLCV